MAGKRIDGWNRREFLGGMALTGTAMRAPLPLVDTAEPLGVGDCASNKYQSGEFELFLGTLED